MAIPRAYQFQKSTFDINKNQTIGLAFPLVNGGNFTRTNNLSDQVKANIINVLLTERGERPMQPTIGCDIRKSLFENFSPQTIVMAKQQIAETIGQYEPRAELINIEASADEDNNALNITILFSLINSDIEETLSLVLERVR